MSDETSKKLAEIQAQLAMLQTDYTSMATAMYDMFFNKTAKDVTLRLYNEKGELVDITVPNRAKDATDKVLYGAGDPNALEVYAKQLGVLYMDTEAQVLYYNTREGWVEIKSSVNFAKDLDYIRPDGDASSLINLNMKNAIPGSPLPVISGGSGKANFGKQSGLLKYVPETVNSRGVKVPACFELADTTDYAAPDDFVGLIGFALSDNLPSGVLVLDGATYRVDYYEKLYNYLHEAMGVEAHSEIAGGPMYFEVPDFRGFYPFFTDKSERLPLTTEDPALPNIKGQWVQEITGVENYFKGAVHIPLQAGKPVQVSGKTSSPGGYCDYLVYFDAHEYNKIYSDDIDDVRVRNIALLPVIKY